MSFPISLSKFIACAVAGASGFCAVAAEPDLLIEARTALAESMPQIAIRKLESLQRGGALGADSQRAAALVLSEALLALGRFEDAMRALDAAPAEDPAAQLLRATIHASADRWAEALPIYEQLAKPADATAAAKLGLAECLAATGATSQAVEVLDRFVQANPHAIVARLRLAALLVDQRDARRARAQLAEARTESAGDALWKRHLEGRLLLIENKPADAIALLEEVTKSEEHVSENLRVAATLALADARVTASGYDAADTVIERFIWKHPESRFLELVFQRLDEIYAGQKDPREGELQKWAAAPEKRRAALARYYVTRMQLRAHKLDRAITSIDAFLRNFPGHSLAPYIRMMQADVEIERRRFPEAVMALEAAEREAKSEELRGEIEFRAGLVHFQQGEFLLAANHFESAARRAPALRQSATFDAALATLNQKNFDRFDEHYRELSRSFPASDLRAELSLEEGLLRARGADPRAAQTLQFYLASFPRHRRQAEAQLALAELAFDAGDQAGAARYLRIVNESTRSAETSEHAEYFAIFLEEAGTPHDDTRAIELARRFIANHPKSPLLPEVRLKLGQVFFRNEDYANAESQLATLAKESPASPYAESALFLAGQSAVKMINPGALERALELFDQVVKRDGPLKLYARQQQAIIQSGMGKEADAIKLYDIILGAQPPADPELRYAAMCAKGDNLALLGRKNPAQLEAALTAFDQLAAADAPAAWRNQALFKKGLALESLQRTDDALLAFYDVLARTTAEDREFLWYYKAGFEAARIFEEAKAWKSAIGIYDKMSVREGPRSAEAQMRIKRLRLEHFLLE